MSRKPVSSSTLRIPPGSRREARNSFYPQAMEYIDYVITRSISNHVEAETEAMRTLVDAVIGARMKNFYRHLYEAIIAPSGRYVNTDAGIGLTPLSHDWRKKKQLSPSRKSLDDMTSDERRGEFSLFFQGIASLNRIEKDSLVYAIKRASQNGAQYGMQLYRVLGQASMERSGSVAKFLKKGVAANYDSNEKRYRYYDKNQREITVREALDQRRNILSELNKELARGFTNRRGKTQIYTHMGVRVNVDPSHLSDFGLLGEELSITYLGNLARRVGFQLDKLQDRDSDVVLKAIKRNARTNPFRHPQERVYTGFRVGGYKRKDGTTTQSGPIYHTLQNGKTISNMFKLERGIRLGRNLIDYEFYQYMFSPRARASIGKQFEKRLLEYENKRPKNGR